MTKRKKVRGSGAKVGEGRARISASILDADLSNLGNAVRRVEAAGADRIHLDIMDGHFVPNLTFGAKTVKALRQRTELPFDVHLMISEPGRYVPEFLDAGSDSITFHVEVDEPVEPVLRAIRAGGRAAGLALRARHADLRGRALHAPPRHHHDHDRGAGVRRAVVHGRRAAREGAQGP